MFNTVVHNTCVITYTRRPSGFFVARHIPAIGTRNNNMMMPLYVYARNVFLFSPVFFFFVITSPNKTRVDVYYTRNVADERNNNVQLLLLLLQAHAARVKEYSS